MTPWSDATVAGYGIDAEASRMNTANVKSFENKRWISFRQSVEFRHTAALELIGESPVLDIGCGDGLLMDLLRDKGIEVVGVDISDEVVKTCVARGSHAEVIESAETLPFPDASFEHVVLLDILEHVYNPVSILAEARRVSKNYVIIGVPNFSSLPARLQMLAGKVPENNRPKKGHIYWFNWQVLSNLVRQCRLRVTAVRINAPWERMPIIGLFMHALARRFPNLFALSFVIMCHKEPHA